MKVLRLIGVAAAVLLMQGCVSVRPAAPPLSRNGVTVDPRFAQYGTYSNHMVTSIQKRWNAILEASKTYPPASSCVVVKFVLAPDGTIARISDVTNHSSKLGERCALEAITQSAPFGTWSDDMKRHLNPAGEELIFTFYYQ